MSTSKRSIGERPGARGTTVIELTFMRGDVSSIASGLFATAAEDEKARDGVAVVEAACV